MFSLLNNPMGLVTVGRVISVSHNSSPVRIMLCRMLSSDTFRASIDALCDVLWHDTSWTFGRESRRLRYSEALDQSESFPGLCRAMAALKICSNCLICRVKTASLPLSPASRTFSLQRLRSNALQPPAPLGRLVSLSCAQSAFCIDKCRLHWRSVPGISGESRKGAQQFESSPLPLWSS